MLNISYYCRPAKANKKGLAPIQMSIILNGKRVFISLPRKENPEVFKKILSSKKPHDLKDYLDATTTTLNKAMTEILSSGQPITLKNLTDFYKTGGVQSYSLRNLFEDYIKIIEKKVDIKEDSKTRYRIVKDEFFAFMEERIDNEVNSLTLGVIMDFRNSLLKTNKEGTVGRKLTFLKAYFNYGFNEGKIKTNPFGSYKITKPKPKIQYLNDAEIQKLSKKKFSTERLERVRDLFLIQASTGLAYVDLAELRADDIVEIGGQLVIDKNRVKTGVEFTAVILPMGKKLLEKYGYNLPMLTNQKYNAYLKEIGDICGIKTHLTTHVARRTYATHLLNSGVRVELVSKSLGHTKTSTTLSHYAHIDLKSMVKEIGKKIK